MNHRAPEVAALPRPSWRSQIFSDKFLPHLAMGVTTIFYVVCLAVFGPAGVPQTISLAWTGMLATWFGYCIRERDRTKENK